MSAHPFPPSLTSNVFLKRSINHSHESLVSPSTTAHATGNILLFASLPIAPNNIPPRNVLRKHPSKHRTFLHPAKKPFFTPSKYTKSLQKVSSVEPGSALTKPGGTVSRSNVEVGLASFKAAKYDPSL